MKVRATLHINGSSRKLILVPGETEKIEHLSLKLAAYILFWDSDLTVEASAKHPALFSWPYRPDLLGMDQTGAVSLWVECGNTTLNKVTKVLRRFPQARVVVLKENQAQARRFKAELEAEAPDPGRVDVLCWPERGFAQWHDKITEQTEIFGEASGLGLNLVVNEQVYVADLTRC